MKINRAFLLFFAMVAVLFMSTPAWAPPPGPMIVRDGHISPANPSYGLMVGSLTAADAPFRVDTTGNIWFEGGSSVCFSGDQVGYADSGDSCEFFSDTLLLDGTRSMTGNLDMDGNGIDAIDTLDVDGTADFATTVSLPGTSVVNADGSVDIVGDVTTYNLDITSDAAADIGLIVKGAPSQSANLQEWQDSDSNVLLSVNRYGNVWYDVPVPEVITLQSFFHATDGPNWVNQTGWITDTTVEDWYGVTVANGRVSQLNLSSQASVAGTGLRFLAPLTALTKLYLHSTSVSGDIAGIAPLTALTTLYLHSTSVSGDIADIAPLTALTNLRLYNTSVSGDIADIATLTALTTLSLYSTSVSGDIADIATLTSLTYLNFGSTSVSGDIAGIAPLTALTYLYLYNTSVSAYTSTTLPAWTGCDIRLYDLGLSESEVDDFLVDLDAAGGTGGILNIGGTNAPPSSTGLTAKTSLEGKGWTVTVSS